MHDDVPQEPVSAPTSDATDDGGPLTRRRPSHARLVLTSALTTVLGAGIALAVMTDAYAGQSHASASATPKAVALQEYVVPQSVTVKKPKQDRFTAFGIPSAPDPDDGASTAPGTVAPVGTAQKYAAKLVADRGWAKTEFACLVSLWSRESGWNTHAGRTDGPYGIPQAYPGSKMAAAGGDWVDDHRVQIRWGLAYIAGRYGTPCKAWAGWQANGSY